MSSSLLEKYGVENISQLPKIIEQKKQTHLKRYGVKAGFNQLEKSRKTCLKNYGVENPTQNKEIHERQLKSAFKLKRYKDTKLYYQGSNELDFLDKYYIKYPEIIRGENINYLFKGENKVYHPDFYISSLNLIIEIKNSWLVKKDRYIIAAKKKATLINGYNYIMIVDKNYRQFNKLINNF